MSLPNPVPLTEPDPDEIPIEDYDKFKKADCANYRSCLTFAARENWKQFACTSCSAYKYAPLDEDEVQLLVTLGKALASLK